MHKLLLFLLLIPSICFASPTEIITAGTYIMGDGETPAVAEERAFVAAKQAAVEEAGSYIESYVQTQNWELTKDEVNVVASGIMQTVVLDKQRVLVPDGGIQFTVRIKALVDSDGVAAMKDKLSNKQLVAEHQQLQEAYARNAQEVAALQLKLASAQDTLQRQEAERQIAENERKFQAERWYEQGRQLMDTKLYSQALTAFNSAIELNPSVENYYLWRGGSYQKLGMHQLAIKDFDQGYVLLMALPPASAGSLDDLRRGLAAVFYGMHRSNSEKALQHQ